VKKERKVDKIKKKQGGRKRVFRIATLVIALTLFVGAWVYTNTSNRSSGHEANDGSAYVRRETKMPLSPALFVGKIETAYQVAQDKPDVLDQLYCYCQCDKHSGHRSLLSCYTDNHAANCDVCVNEALDAAQMLKQGYNMAEIRRQIDRKYSRT
jgi:hypothetical protein